MGSTPKPDSERLTEPRVGSLIGDRYRVEALLDEGAMGQVYSAEHIHMRKRVAIKILRRELTRVPEVLARFEREAMAAANISHQHVAAATDFGKLADHSVYLVLEYVEGRTLRTVLAEGPLAVHRALNIARQIADALTAAHELDIVHRDLKPENVMLVERGPERDYVKVLDFGVAKVPVEITESEPAKRDTGSLITKAGMIFGTPDYMSPEQALGQSVDYRADLYSLGVVLYEMLAGVRPFRADHELGVLGQQLSHGAPPISERAPDVTVPADVEALVRALMANEVSKRVASATVARDELSRLLRNVPDSMPPPRSDSATDVAAESVGAGLALHTLRQDVLPDAVSLSARLRERVVRARIKDWVGGTRALRLRAISFTRQGVQRAVALKNKLPEPLSLMPLWVVVIIPLVFLSGATALVVALSAEQKPVIESVTDAPASPSGGGISEAQIDEALAAGNLAVSSLVERYPGDSRVRLAHARALMRSEKHLEALESIEQLLKLDLSFTSNEHVAGILWKTAQIGATASKTSRLLRGPMAAKGADISYELAVTAGVDEATAESAKAWLSTRAFERNSSKEASAAAALLLAPSCRIRSELVGRAANAGDQRALVLLRAFAAGAGCAKDEPLPCNECLQGSAELKAAIAKLEGQSK